MGVNANARPSRRTVPRRQPRVRRRRLPQSSSGHPMRKSWSHTYATRWRVDSATATATAPEFTETNRQTPLQRAAWRPQPGDVPTVPRPAVDQTRRLHLAATTNVEQHPMQRDSGARVPAMSLTPAPARATTIVDVGREAASEVKVTPFDTHGRAVFVVGSRSLKRQRYRRHPRGRSTGERDRNSPRAVKGQAGRT